MNVTVLGVGAMGARMAANFSAAGHAVTMWNRSPKAGFDLAVSPEVAVSGADIVLSMLNDDAASQSVWLDSGVIQAMPASAIAIEASTITRNQAVLLDAAFAERGIAFVEAPVIGSRPQAEAKQLIVLAGGEAHAVARAGEVLQATAAVVHHLGPVGTAAVMKLAINALFATQVAAFGEILGVIDKSEVDTGRAIELLKSLPITAPGLQRILGLIESEDYAPNFPMRLVAKDLGYLKALAADLDAAAPISNSASGVYAAAAATEAAELDIAGIATRY